MKQLWQFISEPRNLAVLVAAAGGLAFLWTNVVGPRVSPKKPEAAAITQQATASGGQAVNAQGTAQVSIGSSDPPAAASAVDAAKRPERSASQGAQADAGGIAVNAEGAARVTVTGGSTQGK